MGPNISRCRQTNLHHFIRNNQNRNYHNIVAWLLRMKANPNTLLINAYNENIQVSCLELATRVPEPSIKTIRLLYEATEEDNKQPYLLRALDSAIRLNHKNIVMYFLTLIANINTH